MPKITFLPSNTVVDAPARSPLLAAAQQAGLPVETPCGGAGICGKCLVRMDGRWVKICTASVPDTALAEVYVPTAENREGAGQFADFAIDDMPDDTVLAVLPPTYGDGLSDLNRFTRAIGRDISVPLSVLRSLPSLLRENNGKVDIKILGLAVDIGTTTVAVALCDLISGRVIASKTDYNGQIPCGLDVISRINYARKPVQLEELRQRVIGTINDITASICDDPSSITVVSIAGNTTMIHLLLGIPPENIRLHPYIPAVYEAPVYTAGEIGLNVNAHAPVWIAPASGSYVGGDITAGALCTTLVADSPEPVLFIDIGTNGEILLGNNEFLLGCACSAGPAFEGGGIKHGMRAGAGAIERISIVGSDITVHTIGGEPPLGICGSGMISLAAELLKAGIIDPAGRYNQLAIDNEQLTIAEGITVSEADLQNLIRAKAAVYSACAVMLDSVGLQWGDVARVYIAGGFGRYLNSADAATIGLLPLMPRDKMEFMGNTALRGAVMALMDRKYCDMQIETARRMTYIDLSGEPGYMDAYTAALFLPHTDAGLFS